MASEDWTRVNKRNPCPICEHDSWCMVHKDGNAVICPRTFEGAQRDLGDAGYLHMLDPNAPRPDRETFAHRYPQRQRSVPKPAPRGVSWRALSDDYGHRASSNAVATHANQLGVTAESLRRLGIGLQKQRVWSFPMRDPTYCVIGIRLRAEDGKKWAVEGSRAGLFLPENLGPGERLVVCEGPTDTAALLGLGFRAIGRPSCLGQEQMVIDLAKVCDYRDVVIMADKDGPGRDGAAKLATKLWDHCRSVKIVTAHGRNDFREWISECHVSREAVEARITQTYQFAKGQG